MPLVGVARPRPCPATTPDVRPATRDGYIPPTHRNCRRDRHGRLGLGAAASLARRPGRAPGRVAVLRYRRPDPRAALVERQRARRVPPPRGPGGYPAPLRAAQAAPRTCRQLAREGMPLNVIQRQLGHANLGTTSIYLQGIDTDEIIATVHARRAPLMSATAGLQL